MRPVFDYMDYRKYLKDAFEERKLADARLSYRNLADSLGLDGSNLHKILQSRSHLPARCQSRVLKFLGLGNPYLTFDFFPFEVPPDQSLIMSGPIIHPGVGSGVDTVGYVDLFGDRTIRIRDWTGAPVGP